jgi:DNA replication protein DnaC
MARTALKMGKSPSTDPERTGKLLGELGLTVMARELESVSAESISKKWGFQDTLSELMTREITARQQRKIARLLKDSQLPEGKTLSTLDPNKVSVANRQHLAQLIRGEFIHEGINILAFGLPGRGKSHYLTAIGHEMIITHGERVLFTPSYKLIQRLLDAKRQLALAAELRKLDQYSVVILDDLGYVRQSREEMEVLFTFFAERYERRSVMISSNLVFSKWDGIFHDPLTAMAAVDRLVHHSVILEFQGKSLRDPDGEKTVMEENEEKTKK